MSDGDGMLYDKGAMITLFDTLNSHHSTLIQQEHDLQTAAGKLQNAWEGNASLASFQIVKHDWDTQYGDTLVILNKVAAEVENSLHRALGTDQKIGDGFGA
jgi:uncharacterized protein YukE